MGILDLFRRIRTNFTQEPDSENISIHIQYGQTTLPESSIQIGGNEPKNFDLEIEYVKLSTSGDENVCPMCAQFEDKIFPASEAPKLPLCPSCACVYISYFKGDLPKNSTISNKNDFVLPAECTFMFHKNQQKAYEETDPVKIIRLCEGQLRKLLEFMEPYISANFPAPDELACRDLLPKLYMELGQWEKAKKVINKCIEAKAYFPNNGLEELNNFESYRKVATETLSYIQQHQGCLQRNIYKSMNYEGEKREYLKHFLRYNKQIRKVKHNNTNELYYD